MAIAVASLLMGAGAILVSLAFGGEPRGEPLGPNRAVNAGATDPRDLAAHNSPTLVRNPVNARNLVIANRIDTPRYSCALHVSNDAGATWSQTPLPVPAGEEPKCYAPDVAFGPDGTLYLSFVTLAGLGNVPHAGWVSTSHDGGRTLSGPMRSVGRLAFGLRILADPKVRGRLYLTWLHAREVGLFTLAQPGNPILMVRSDDGGRTWSEASIVSSAARGRVLAATPAIAADGTLDVVYLDIGDDRLDYEGAHGGRGGPPYPGPWSLVLSRSNDHGATWAEAVVAPKITPTERFIAFIPPVPAFAVAPDARHLYVAFSDRSGGDADVRLWRSADGGAHWTAVRVNDTPPRDGRTQTRPQLDVAPNGRVDVIYYDRRDDPRDVRNEVSLQSSFDGGATFAPRVRLTDRAFDSRIGQGSERGMPDLGSRLALLSTDQRALAVWPDTRNGTQASGKQDLDREVVAFVAPARIGVLARTGLQLAGAALVALGLLLLLARVQLARTRLSQQ